jgi:hypothetical protein
MLHVPVNWKKVYSTLEMLNILYDAGDFCLSVLGDRIYVFHISELMSIVSLFMMLSFLHF